MSLLALFLSLWLATMPVAFMFSMGCCCGTTGCTGSFEGDCCTSTLPAQLDVTIPADYSNASPVVCNACASIGGTTYTLTGGNTYDDCLGSFFAGGDDNEYSYRSTSYCNSTSAICGTQSADLLIVARLYCSSGQCYLAVNVSLSTAPACCCAFNWYYQVPFDTGIDCDAEVWSVPYVSRTGSNPANCNVNCDIAASPSDITVTKT